MTRKKFRVGLAPSFLDLDGRLRFKDIGLDLLEQEPHIEYHFIKTDQPFVPLKKCVGLTHSSHLVAFTRRRLLKARTV